MDSPDRAFLSRYQPETVGLAVSVGGVSTDVDGNAVTVMYRDEDTQQIVFTRQASHYGLGSYTLELTPDDTSRTGNFVIQWSYLIGGTNKTYSSYVSVDAGFPEYDALPPEIKPLVDSVWTRLADLFDAPNGGPNLQAYKMTHFNRGRIAQLAHMAVGRLNTAAQPYATYTIEKTGMFPVAKWGYVLEKAIWVETIRHLRRSYLEQPMLMGENLTRDDRRDYFDRWGEILREEEADLTMMFDTFRIANMGLARPAVLVTGGAYGNFRYPRVAGMEGRPRFYYQNY